MENMGNYFEVTTEMIVGMLKSGKPKKIKEVYLVNAMSVTEAEARVVKEFLAESSTSDYRVVSAKESRVLRVIE